MAFAFSLMPLYALRSLTSNNRLIVFIAPCLILIGVLASIWIAARFLDRRRMSDFGLSLDRRWWSDLCFGMFLGGLLATTLFVLQLAIGWVEIVGWFQHADPAESFGTVIASYLVLAICVGIYEEVSYRGYLLRNIAEGTNFSVVGPNRSLVLAVTVTSLAFALAHARNPNASVTGIINTVLGSFVYGSPFLLAGRLGLPIGIHITWNFFQGPVFGFRVSGVGFGGSVITTSKSGPALWTGGEYGLEGGLLATGMLAVALPLMLGWIRFRYGRLAINTCLAQAPSPIATQIDEQSS
jgi:hypothetical protein